MGDEGGSGQFRIAFEWVKRVVVGNLEWLSRDGEGGGGQFRMAFRGW